MLYTAEMQAFVQEMTSYAGFKFEKLFDFLFILIIKWCMVVLRLIMDMKLIIAMKCFLFMKLKS